MENSSFRDGKQFAWDATSLDLASACPRKYFYRMIRGITPSRQSVHLLFGGVYASALENFYKHRAEGMTLEEAECAVVRLAMLLSWDHPRDESGARLPGGQPLSFDSAEKTRMNLIRSIVWYIEQFGDESEGGAVTHHLANGKPAVELSFTLPFDEDILYCGHLDRVVDFNGSLYWMDQKTTGHTITPKFFEDFTPNNQFSGYSWAGRAILHSPINAGIVDGAQIAVGFTRFARGIIVRTPEQLEEWHDSALQIIHQTRAYSDSGKWPMNTTACGNYGGCPYRQLCSRSPTVREHYVEGNFTVPPRWDPLKAR